MKPERNKSNILLRAINTVVLAANIFLAQLWLSRAMAAISTR